jgi:hypothetical protein
MNRQEIERLLASYATGGLNGEEEKLLLEAALSDQELFNQLMEEDSIREAIALPGARARLIEALQEDEENVFLPAAAPTAQQALQAKPVRRPPLWMAWAAGAALLFVSGSITYMLLDRGSHPMLARRDVKPFPVPPEAPAVSAPAAGKPVLVDQPPKVGRTGYVTIPKADIALPSAPSPPQQPVLAESRAAEPAAPASSPAPGAPQNRVKEEKAAVDSKSLDQAGPAPASPVMAYRQQQQQQQAAEGGGAGAESDRQREQIQPPMRAAPPPARLAAGSASANLPPPVEVSAWRDTGGGVWVRLTPDETIARSETVVIRYTPAADGLFALTGDNGASIDIKQGRASRELVFAVPEKVLQAARGNTLRLSVEPAGDIRKSAGERRTRDEQSRTIILRLR